MDTERLYSQLDDAENEITDIHAKSNKLKEDIAVLIRAFAANYRCSDKSMDYALDYTADALTDLIDDAEGPACRRKVRLENEISGALPRSEARR